MNVKTFSNAVITIGAIACVVIPTTRLLAHTTSCPQQVIKPLPAAPRQAPNASNAMRQPVKTYRVPVRQRQIYAPQARRNIRVAPGAVPSRSNVAMARPAVAMGPASGPVGSAIRLQVNRNLGAVPALLSFKAVISRGVPARVHVRLSGRGTAYAIRAPIQLCMQGGGTWQAELVLSNGRNIGVIGQFTPTNCPR